MKKTLAVVFTFILVFSVFSVSSAEKTAEIRFVNHWVKEELTQTYPLDLVNNYLSQNPQVKLEWEAYSPGDLAGVIFQTQAAANDMPDLFMINSLNMRQAYNGGLLLPLSELLTAAENKEWFDSLLDNWKETTFDGEVYGVPFQFITNECVYYNKEILSQYGYDEFPSTWDEVFELAEKLKNDGIIPIALGNKDGWPAWSNIGEILCEYYCGPEWVEAIGRFDPTARYDTPEFHKVIEMLKRINENLLNSDSVAINNVTEDKDYFYSGDAAILLGGSYTLQPLIDYAPEGFMDKVGVAPIPRPNDALESIPSGIFTGGSGWELAINANITEDKKTACIEIIKILTGNDFARNDLETGKIPVLKNELYPAYDKSKVSPQMLELTKLISSAPQLTLMNQQQQGSMASVLFKTIQEVQVDTKNVEEAVNAIQASYEEVCLSLQK
ncbi:MAG: ABC transporter substrate-binding protein [Christensenellaceae bacterium]